MAVSWDTPGVGGEMGRCRGQRGSFYGSTTGWKNAAEREEAALPPGVDPGSHGGSHGYLCNEFVSSILENRKPWCDIAQASEHDGGGDRGARVGDEGWELLKIKQYVF
jgi:hypothetical protein